MTVYLVRNYFGTIRYHFASEGFSLFFQITHIAKVSMCLFKLSYLFGSSIKIGLRDCQ